MSRRIPRPSVEPIADNERRELERARQRERGRARTRRARGVARARTLMPRHMTRAMLAAEAFVTTLVPAEVLADRPRTRGDCRDAERPCPWAACKYHLYLDVNPETGSLKINFPDRELWDLDQTCALDVAERGGATLEAVGLLANLTRERVRQIELKASFAMKVDPTLMDAA